MTNSQTILLVENNEALRTSLSDQLHLHEEFETHTATTGAEALVAGQKRQFDLILLNAGLPDMDGREVCRLMRRGGIGAPILMLTDASTEADIVLGLNSGANDYIRKPFKLNDLLARIRLQLRQRERSEDAVYSIGPYTFRPAAKSLTNDDAGNKVRLTEKEAAILKYLIGVGDQVIGRDVLLNEVWGYNSGVTTHTLETHVYRLRQKIERDPSNAELLVTEAGGYRLVS